MLCLMFMIMLYIPLKTKKVDLAKQKETGVTINGYTKFSY